MFSKTGPKKGFIFTCSGWEKTQAFSVKIWWNFTTFCFYGI